MVAEGHQIRMEHGRANVPSTLLQQRATQTESGDSFASIAYSEIAEPMQPGAVANKRVNVDRLEGVDATRWQRLVYVAPSTLIAVAAVLSASQKEAPQQRAAQAESFANTTSLKIGAIALRTHQTYLQTLD